MCGFWPLSQPRVRHLSSVSPRAGLFLDFMLRKMPRAMVTSVALLVSCREVNTTSTSKLNVLSLVLLPVRKCQESQLRTNISFMFPSLTKSKYLSDISRSFTGEKPASPVLLQNISTLDRSSREKFSVNLRYWPAHTERDNSYFSNGCSDLIFRFA